MVVFHNMEGHRSFLLGQYPSHRLKLYFPVAMLLKWPLIILLLGAAGAGVVLRRKHSRQPRSSADESFSPPSICFFADHGAHQHRGSPRPAALPVSPALCGSLRRVGAQLALGLRGPSFSAFC